MRDSCRNPAKRTEKKPNVLFTYACKSILTLLGKLQNIIELACSNGRWRLRGGILKNTSFPLLSWVCRGICCYGTVMPKSDGLFCRGKMTKEVLVSMMARNRLSCWNKIYLGFVRFSVRKMEHGFEIGYDRFLRWNITVLLNYITEINDHLLNNTHKKHISCSNFSMRSLQFDTRVIINIFFLIQLFWTKLWLKYFWVPIITFQLCAYFYINIMNTCF